MSRVLVAGDLAATGFGTVTMDLGHAMLDRGEDVRFVSLNEGAWLDGMPEWLKGRVLDLGGMGWVNTLTARSSVADGDDPPTEEQLQAIDDGLAKIKDMFGSLPWPDGWRPDAAIIIGDVGSVKMSPLPGFIPDGFPVFHYVPIEGIDLPPRWNLIWGRMVPVAMSEFGAIEIEKIHGSRPPVVYHGVDTTVFHPASDRPVTYTTARGLVALRSRTECKQFLGDIGRQFPDVFPGLARIHPDRLLIFRADRNVPRKRYPSLLRALAPVLDRHPDADFLYHCLTVDQGGDLADDISKFRPDIAERMNPTGFHDHRAECTRAMLAILYNAADIYVSSSAEGFGLTIAEAIACGTPAVAMGFSSVPEVVGGAGILVQPGFYDDNIFGHYWAGIHEVKFAEAVERLVMSRGARRDLGNKGPIHVGALFSWVRAAEQFSELIAERLGEKVAA